MSNVVTQAGPIYNWRRDTPKTQQSRYRSLQLPVLGGCRNPVVSPMPCHVASLKASKLLESADRAVISVSRGSKSVVCPSRGRPARARQAVNESWHQTAVVWSMKPAVQSLDCVAVFSDGEVHALTDCSSASRSVTRKARTDQRTWWSIDCSTVEEPKAAEPHSQSQGSVFLQFSCGTSFAGMRVLGDVWFPGPNGSG